MIENLNFEKLARPNEIAGDSDVRVRRLRFAARMIVDEHNGSGGGNHGRAEYIAWLDKNRVECPNADEAMALDSAAGIQEQRHETLTLRVEIRVRENVSVPILNDFFRHVTKLQILRRGTLPERDNLEFFGIERVHIASVRNGLTVPRTWRNPPPRHRHAL